MSEPRTQTLEVPGACLSHDIRDAGGGTAEPLLLMIGLPMDASGFGALAEHFDNRTVVTYDPRGTGRSERTDGGGALTPDVHADDLHRLITALGPGQVEIFGSSGGAVVGLALVARHPEQVRLLVAHEPPSAPVLPDREQALAATVGIHKTYERDGFGPAMAKFIALTMTRGPIPDGFADQPGPNPADFGLPTEDDGSGNDPLLGQNIVGTTHYEHDFEALRAAPTQIVIGVGAESEANWPTAPGSRSPSGSRPIPSSSQPPWGLLGWRIRLSGRPRRLRRDPPQGARSLREDLGLLQRPVSNGHWARKRILGAGSLGRRRDPRSCRGWRGLRRGLRGLADLFPGRSAEVPRRLPGKPRGHLAQQPAGAGA